MILVFDIVDDGNLTVRIKNDAKIEEFKYPKFIEALLSGQVIDNCEYPEDINEETKSKIEAMIAEILEATKAKIEAPAVEETETI